MPNSGPNRSIASSALSTIDCLGGSKSTLGLSQIRLDCGRPALRGGDAACTEVYTLRDEIDHRGAELLEDGDKRRRAALDWGRLLEEMADRDGCMLHSLVGAVSEDM